MITARPDDLRKPCRLRTIRHLSVVALTAEIVLLAMVMATPPSSASSSTVVSASVTTVTVTAPSVTQSTTSSSPSQAPSPKVTLSATSEGAGVRIGMSASGLAASRNISATFGNVRLVLTGTCTTSSTGALSGCYFSVPGLPHGSYPVVVSDGTNSLTISFTIPVVSIPESTLLVTTTSIGLSLVTQLVTRRIVDLDAERRMKAEVSAFNKEKREATLAKDKAKLEKLKKRELPMRQEQAKVSTARLKVTAITFVPLLAVYYLMASFLGGFSVVVAHSPVPIPYLVGAQGTMALFWWYMLSSFTFSTILTKLLHTTT